MGNRLSDTDTLTMTIPLPETPTSPVSVVRAYGQTHRGQVRPSNEDQFVIARLVKSMSILQSSLQQPARLVSEQQAFLFLVADGMGGHQAGEQASALALTSVEQFMLNRLKWFFNLKGPEEQTLLSEFQTALRQADSRVYEEAMRHPELHGMGTTLTLAFLIQLDLFVVHVGDSRCYLWHDGTLDQLTRDHTFVQELVRRGHLSPAEAANHRFRHVITNVIGGKERGIDVEVHRTRLQVGDKILLCSDGLTEMVPDEFIASVLQEESEPQRTCERLIAEANDRGGKDNITTILVHLDESR